MDTAYLSVPTRPPTVKSVGIPSNSVIEYCYSVFLGELGIDHTSLIVGYEGDNFSFTDNIELDLLSTMSVHPMREDAIRSVLSANELGWELIDNLLTQGKIMKINFFLRFRVKFCLEILNKCSTGYCTIVLISKYKY